MNLVFPFAIVCSHGNWHNSKQGNQFETLNVYVIWVYKHDVAYINMAAFTGEDSCREKPGKFDFMIMTVKAPILGNRIEQAYGF